MNAPWGATASLLLLWMAMGIAVVSAFRVGRPAGLLEFKALDLLWGVSLGVGLRLCGGIAASVNEQQFPGSGPNATGSGGDWTEAVLRTGAAGVGGPLIEEFFFRAIVLVAVFELLRRSVGIPAAALTAALSSAGLFVMLHAVFQPVTLIDGVLLVALGLGCSAIVLLTGRLWGAVIAHATYNFVLLSIVATGGLLS